MKKKRKSVNTTLDADLYNRLQILALKEGAKKEIKIHVNDLLEEGMICILEKYEKTE